MVTEKDSNISFAGFANEAELAERLGAGDIHMLSLREGWEGIVVPSKFFGSLAAGKAILYEGSRASSIKTWIEEYDLGFVLTADNLVEVADELCRFADNPELLRRKQENTFNCYHEHFSARAVIDNWDSFMRDLLHA